MKYTTILGLALAISSLSVYGAEAVDQQPQASPQALTSAKVVDPPKRNIFKRIFRSKWAGVDPLLRQKIEPVLKQLKDEGFDVRMVEGRRSHKRQAQLLASGKGVTKAGAGRSCHNWGLAIDSAVYVKGKPSWDLTNPHVAQGYARYGELAKQAGLSWGGDWKDPVDMPHVELKTDCRLAIRKQKRIDRDAEMMLAYEPHEEDAETFAFKDDYAGVTVEELPLENPVLKQDYETCLATGFCLYATLSTPWTWEPVKLSPFILPEPVQAVTPACEAETWWNITLPTLT